MKLSFKTKKFRKAVFIVVYRKQEDSRLEYLILKRKKHWLGWEFPKGGINAGEKPIQTAKRECFEESGLKVIKIQAYPQKGSYLYPKKLADRPDFKGQTWKLFSAQVKFGKVKFDSKEHSGFLWLDFNKALKKITYANQKKCLKIVNKKISKEK